MAGFIYCVRSGFEEKVLTLTGLSTLSVRRAHHLSVCEAADSLKRKMLKTSPRKV